MVFSLSLLENAYSYATKRWWHGSTTSTPFTRTHTKKQSEIQLNNRVTERKVKSLLFCMNEQTIRKWLWYDLIRTWNDIEIASAVFFFVYLSFDSLRMRTYQRHQDKSNCIHTDDDDVGTAIVYCRAHSDGVGDFFCLATDGHASIHIGLRTGESDNKNVMIYWKTMAPIFIFLCLLFRLLSYIDVIVTVYDKQCHFLILFFRISCL